MHHILLWTNAHHHANRAEVLWPILAYSPCAFVVSLLVVFNFVVWLHYASDDDMCLFKHHQAQPLVESHHCDDMLAIYCEFLYFALFLNFFLLLLFISLSRCGFSREIFSQILFSPPTSYLFGLVFLVIVFACLPLLLLSVHRPSRCLCPAFIYAHAVANKISIYCNMLTTLLVQSCHYYCHTFYARASQTNTDVVSIANHKSVTCSSSPRKKSKLQACAKPFFVFVFLALIIVSYILFRALPSPHYCKRSSPRWTIKIS